MSTYPRGQVNHFGYSALVWIYQGIRWSLAERVLDSCAKLFAGKIPWLVRHVPDRGKRGAIPVPELHTRPGVITSSTFKSVVAWMELEWLREKAETVPQYPTSANCQRCYLHVWAYLHLKPKTPCFQLLNAYCSLFTAPCLLLPVHCSLLTAHCSPLTQLSQSTPQLRSSSFTLCGPLLSSGSPAIWSLSPKGCMHSTVRTLSKPANACAARTGGGADSC